MEFNTEQMTVIADTVSKTIENKIESKMEEKMNKMNMVANLIGGNSATVNTETKSIKINENFYEYLQLGTVAKSLSTLVPADGGYLVPDNWYERIVVRARELSPIRENAGLSTISVGNSLLVPVEGTTDFATGWIAEDGDRVNTVNGDFSQIQIDVHEMYANPMATRAVLMDNAYDLESYIIEKIAEQFALQEGLAFVKGNGIGKPFGLLEAVTGITTTTVETSANTAITYGNLVDLVYGVKSKYAKNGKFYMNRKTVGYLQGVADTTGQPLYRPSAIVGQPATMLGYPVIEVDAIDGFVPGAGSAGKDVILFGDMKQAYHIVDRTDVGLQRDDITKKGFVQFYAYKRVGGKVVLPEALGKLKIKA
jgi:HK97 family phage major capsid protein